MLLTLGPLILLSRAGFEGPPRIESKGASHAPRPCCGPEFTARRGSVLLDGKEVHIKGLSWFGFEGDNAVADGLWQHSVDSYLDFLVANQFNALRMPLALNNVLNNPVPSHSMVSAEPRFVGEDSLWLLEMIVMRAARKGILVLLDMHRLNSSLWPDPQGLWYNDHVSLETLKGSWMTLAQRFCRHWNVFGADVFNEVCASLFELSVQVTALTSHSVPFHVLSGIPSRSLTVALGGLGTMPRIGIARPRPSATRYCVNARVGLSSLRALGRLAASRQSTFGVRT